MRIKVNNASVLISDAVNAFLSDKLCSPITEVTYKGYEYMFNKILPRFIDTNLPIERITEVYGAISKASIKQSSKNSYLAMVKTFIKHYNETCDEKIPLPNISAVDCNKRGYTDEELAKLLVRPKKWKSFCDYRGWFMVTFLLDTGVRKGTLIAIRIKDIDFDNHFITCRHTKNKKPLLVPLSKYLEKELKEYLKVRGGKPDDALFCSCYSKPLNNSTVAAAIRLYNASRGVEYHSIHAFRHTFARKYLIDMHGDLFKLQKLMGHSSMTMTAHYANITIDDLVDDFREASPIVTMNKNRIKL